MSYKMVRNCMVDPLHVINMCYYEKASECYISQSLDEAESGLRKKVLVDKGTLGSW